MYTRRVFLYKPDFKEWKNPDKSLKELYFPDLLHFSAEGYKVFAKRDFGAFWHEYHDLLNLSLCQINIMFMLLGSPFHFVLLMVIQMLWPVVLGILCFQLLMGSLYVILMQVHVIEGHEWQNLDHHIYISWKYGPPGSMIIGPSGASVVSGGS